MKQEKPMMLLLVKWLLHFGITIFYAVVYLIFLEVFGFAPIHAAVTTVCAAIVGLGLSNEANSESMRKLITVASDMNDENLKELINK